VDPLATVASSAADLARRVAAGAAPSDWTPAEAVLAMMILVYGDPSRLGGTKVDAAGARRQHPAVVAAARATGRTDGAVVYKVMNLRSIQTDGSRGFAHGAAVDRWVVSAFGSDLDGLLTAAVLVARAVPGAADVIRGLDSPPALASLTGDHLHWVVDPSATERDAVVTARRGQGMFRARVMANYLHSCAFCGLRSRLPAQNSYLLVASHILPWAEATSHDRLDPTNGLALCAIHDRAFEWGFLSLDEDLRVVVSAGAREHYEPEERVRAEIVDLGGRAIVTTSKHFARPGGRYLEHHRQNIFDRRFRAAYRV